MSKLYFYILLGLFTISSQITDAAFYQVIRTDGIIYNYSRQKNIEQGDRIHDNDTVVFMAQTARMLMVPLSDTDTLLVEFPENTDFLPGIGFLVKDIAQAFRADQVVWANLKQINDLPTYFGNKKFSILGDTLHVALDAQMYPLNNNKFIVLYYKINNRQVSKKIGFDNQVLILEKDMLLQSKGEKISGNTIKDVHVYQYEISTKESVLLTRIDLVFVDKTMLLDELQSVYTVIMTQPLSLAEKKTFLHSYVENLYGNTDMQILNTLIEQVVK